MNKPPADWKILSESLYEEFKIFSARKSTRLNPRTGKPFDFFLMSGLNWCNVIPITPQNNVVMVKQYRHGADEYTLEIPGGVVDPGEDPLFSAGRELLEETGYSTTDICELGWVYSNPAMMSMRTYSYLAKNVSRVSEQKLDPGEDIEIIELPLNRVLEMLKSGQINHALVSAAFTHYLLKNTL